MALSPTQKEAARFIMRRYMERAEINRARIFYSQYRPMNHLGKSPDSTFTTDCSGYTTGVYYWADKLCNFKLNDPNGMYYGGYGFTGTLLAHNRSRRVPIDRQFFIGDMALYGPSLSNTTHVIICRKNGEAWQAIWSNHGSAAGPYSVKLNYRGDLLCVVRSADLA